MYRMDRTTRLELKNPALEAVDTMDTDVNPFVRNHKRESP
jgi:hypothetical protein